MKLVDMKPRSRYRFQHKRKGAFEGVFLRVEALPEGDHQDAEVYVVAIDTADGSGAEWLRRAAGANVTESGLRPSLIEKVEEV